MISATIEVNTAELKSRKAMSVTVVNSEPGKGKISVERRDDYIVIKASAKPGTFGNNAYISLDPEQKALLIAALQEA